MTAPMLEIVTLLLLCAFSEMEAAGEPVVLEARSATKISSNSTLSVCVFYNKLQNMPAEANKKHFHPLVDHSYTEGCSVLDFLSRAPSLVNSVVAFMRGTCNFNQKASMVQDAKGAAILVVDHINSTWSTTPAGTDFDFESFNITIVVISHNDYMKVLSLSQLVEVAIYAPVRPHMDLVIILVIVLSTALVVAGAAWSAYGEFHHMKRSRLRAAESHAHAEDDANSISALNKEPQTSVLVITVWFGFMCSVTLSVYFFYDVMVFFFIVLFCILGSFSLYKCLNPLWSRIVPVMFCISTDSLYCASCKTLLRDNLLVVSCLTVGIYWVIERHAKYAWVIQDLLGSAFCVYCIHTLRLRNLKLTMTLLIQLLLYDIFFIFVTPLFTSDQTSIMESIATGKSGHSKETLPIMLLFPNLGDSPWRMCLGRNFTLLGLTDVIFPGLLVAHNAVFDIKTGNRMLYFICSSIGYFVGMIVCITVLFYTKSGQPALLYLVPSTLLTTVILAVIRQEFRSMYLGQHSPHPTTDDHIEPSTVDVVKERDFNGNGFADEERNIIQ